MNMLNPDLLTTSSESVPKDLNVLFCPQTKDIQLAAIEEERNQKIFTFKKPESETIDFLVFKSINGVSK